MDKYFKESSDLLTLTKIKNTLEKYDFNEHYEKMKKRSVVVKIDTNNNKFLVIVSAKTHLINLNLSSWGNTVFNKNYDYINCYEYDKIYYYWFECYSYAKIIQFRANYDNPKDDVKIEVCSLNVLKNKNHITKSKHPFFYVVGRGYSIYPEKREDNDGKLYFRIDETLAPEYQDFNLFTYNKTLEPL